MSSGFNTLARAMYALTFLLAFSAKASKIGLKIKSGNPAIEAMKALDTDHSGAVEAKEVEAFASSQGLSAAEVRADFGDIDINHNGELEADEIASTLGAASAEVAESSGAKPAALATPVVPTALAAPNVPAAPPARIVPAAPAAPVVPATPMVVAEGAVTTPATTPSSALNLLDLELKQQAGKALAQIFAKTATTALEKRAQDAAKAASMEQAAKALRVRLGELKRTAAEQTQHAAEEAAAAVLGPAKTKSEELERRAAEAEKKAFSRRAEAKEAMDQALHAQVSMAASVKSLAAEGA